MQPGTQARFVWHDLMTGDVAGARRFYGALFGWKFSGSKDEQDPYLHLESRGVLFGGMVKLAQPGIPPHWLSYVEVADVDVCAERAQDCGGKLALPPREIPGVGRFAVIVDPTGAHLAPFRSVEPSRPEREVLPEDRRFCWDELLTRDSSRAGAFYAEVFGWRVQEVPMGPHGTYHLFKRGVLDAAGMMQMPQDAAAPAHWLAYVSVPDVDESARAIAERGGKLWVEPRDIPGIGRFAVAADPQGASFAVFRRLGDAA
jgi:predicted enzyme related to lactoylglutathione lyase